MKLKDKVVVITGGGSGIGLASARLMKAEGARIVIVGRTAKTLEAACRELGSDAIAIQADVSELEDVKRVMAEVKSKHGRIDVLFANAGISECPAVEETTEAAFGHVVGINFKGPFFAFAQALPLLSERASVIFTGSAAHDMGRLGDPLYSATKAAVRSLVRTFAVNETVVARKIRVNAVSPGCVKTPLTEPAHTSADVTAYLESLIPMRRWGEPEEIARAVLFLACADSSYMTGADLAVDGGLGQV
jgi:NAD(P)-dependent dehydrogenase (short-subunit alcohol dehydrogenase family)